MQSDHLELGRAGEARAADYLVQRGYRILERNARADNVEIDLVAARGSTLVFVEVKTRRGRRFGPPEAAVDGRKQARLARGAAAWLRSHATRARRVRFDVVACDVDADATWRVRHWEGAFEA